MSQSTGHCLCGAIKYSISTEPLWSLICHCSDCRRSVGNALATFVVFQKNSFSLQQGELKSFQSSPGVERSFCPHCGTPIAYQSTRISDEIHILVGSLDCPEQYPPQLEVFCREQLPWLEISIDGPSFDALPKNRPGS